MARSSAWAWSAALLDGPRVTSTEWSALKAPARRKGPPAVEAFHARPALPAVRDVRAEGQPPGFAALPEGYVPLREARDLELLGRWPLLEDRMPACLSPKVLLVMQRRRENGDQGAETWLKIYARAYAGDAEAQRAFGRVCENGTFRAPADLQRAFFWYYQAALQGDFEARKDSERLKLMTKISPAAMADPVLVHAGPWRITVDMFGEVCSTSLFELADNGALSGYLIDGDSAVDGMVEAAQDTLREPRPPFLLPSVMQNVQYGGRWAYDNARRIVTIAFTAIAADRPDKRTEAWQIELLGCKPGAIFGRDRRMVAYTLEYMGAGADARPPRWALPA